MIMKNSKALILTILVLTATLFGCNQKKIQQLEEQNQTLLSQTHVQDSIVNDFLSTFNELESNLNQIKERENLISAESDDPELRKSGKEKIMADMAMIDELMVQNKSLIEELESKVKNSQYQLGKFKNMVSSLSNQVEEKDGEIATLKEELTQKDFSIEQLTMKVDTLNQVTTEITAQNEAQSETIAMQEDKIEMQTARISSQTEALNTAYYIAGSTKDLKEKNVISKEGGLLGLGSTKVMNEDVTDEVFTRIDITQVTTIPFDAKKVSLATSHPTDSYSIVEENDTEILAITNPEKFWKNSKYLVVITN